MEVRGSRCEDGLREVIITSMSSKREPLTYKDTFDEKSRLAEGRRDNGVLRHLG